MVATGSAPSQGEGEQEGPSAAKPAVVHGQLRRFGDVGDPLSIVFVRHGQTPLTVLGAYSGSSVPGPPLNTQGRIEAARAADLVARVGRDAWPDIPRPSELVASPMVRTQETAAAVGRRLGLHVRTEPAFAEANFGDWEGRTASDIGESQREELVAWHTTGTMRAPSGESAADVGDRVAHGIDALARDGGGRTVVVVAHTIVIRAAVGLALGAPPRTWNGLRITPGSLTILRRWSDGMSEIAALGYTPL